MNNPLNSKYVQPEGQCARLFVLKRSNEVWVYFKEKTKMKRLMVCVIILSIAGIANAVITFDEFPVGTLIDNDYAAFGVEFLAGTVTGKVPQRGTDAAMRSEPILRPTNEDNYYAYQGDFRMKFTTPVIDATFDSGYWNGVGPAVIHVYDPDMSFPGSIGAGLVGWLRR